MKTLRAMVVAMKDGLDCPQAALALLHALPPAC